MFGIYYLILPFGTVTIASLLLAANKIRSLKINDQVRAPGLLKSDGANLGKGHA